MKESEVRERAFAMPLTSPAYPPGPYRFVNREFFIVAYRTDPEALKAVIPAPLDVRRSFRDHLQTERTTAIDAFRYRKVPFARVVAAVSPARELGVHPLFQVLFSWETAAASVTTADGLTFDTVAVAD